MDAARRGRRSVAAEPTAMGDSLCGTGDDMATGVDDGASVSGAAAECARPARLRSRCASSSGIADELPASGLATIGCPSSSGAGCAPGDVGLGLERRDRAAGLGDGREQRGCCCAAAPPPTYLAIFPAGQAQRSMGA
jgi:hypothetical protein